MSRTPLPVPDLNELAGRHRRLSEYRFDVTAQLAREYSVSRATMGRWISLARQLGLIERWDPRRVVYRCPECGWRCRGLHVEEKGGEGNDQTATAADGGRSGGAAEDQPVSSVPVDQRR